MKKMKVSDYIVDYLIRYGVRHVFGYPGGMVTHLIDSLGKRGDEIRSHLTYHEQGAAFAACGYAQAVHGLGVAFATSGPGATNLVTGICNAYYESVPVLFLTGQVNTFESKTGKDVRQSGFQETDIVAMVRGVTKFSAYVEKAEKIRSYLDQAVYAATHDRPGAVLLDIPMDIMRAEIEPEALEGFDPTPDAHNGQVLAGAEQIIRALSAAKRPVFVLGNGIKISCAEEYARELVARFHVPAVSSMIGIDILGRCPQYYGFLGAYGSRAANFIVAKADLVVAFGSRLDIRQVGKNREKFAPNAKIIRVDIDEGELAYAVHPDETDICADVGEILRALCKESPEGTFDEWEMICRFIRSRVEGLDERMPNIWMERFLRALPPDSLICVDVGQNQVWAAQAAVKAGDHRMLFSGSNGAMGFALPAAIGASIGLGKRVYVITGDGGMQMNLQELQTIAREHLPVKVAILNNDALGMIRHFQEMYFNKDCYMTIKNRGYSSPDFDQIAAAYGISHTTVSVEEQSPAFSEVCEPEVMTVIIDEDTYVFPKLEYGRDNQDQEPLLDRETYSLLMDDEAILKEAKKAGAL